MEASLRCQGPDHGIPIEFVVAGVDDQVELLLASIQFSQALHSMSTEVQDFLVLTGRTADASDVTSPCATNLQRKVSQSTNTDHSDPGGG